MPSLANEESMTEDPYPFRHRCCRKVTYETMRTHQHPPWKNNVVKQAFADGYMPNEGKALFVLNNNARYVENALETVKAMGLDCALEISDLHQGIDRKGPNFNDKATELIQKGVTFVQDKIHKRRYHTVFMIYALEGICPRSNRKCLLEHIRHGLRKNGRLWLEIRGRDYIEGSIAKAKSCEVENGYRTAARTYVKILAQEEIEDLLNESGFSEVTCIRFTTKHIQFVATRSG